MTKTHRKAASSAEDAFNRHYATIWGEERWRQSLQPALARPTRYACLLNRYVPLEHAKQQIMNPNTEDVPLHLPKIDPTGDEDCCLQLNVVVRNASSELAEQPPLPANEQFPAPEERPGSLNTHWNLDAASVLVAYLLNVQHGDNVLDLCAAPGGKSVALAQGIWHNLHSDKTNTQQKALQQLPLRIGTLHSNEFDGPRQRRLADNLKAYLPEALFGSQNVASLRVDGTNPKALYDLRVKTLSGTVGYDKVLVDAPCSSERHIIHAHAKARSGGRDAPEMANWRPGSSKRLAETQLKLLMAGLKVANIGATVMYATCSIEPNENDGVIEKMLLQIGKDKKKGIKWSVNIGFNGAAGDEALESDLEQNWAERTKYGWIVLPDHPAGGQWGPLYFAILTKTAD